MYLEMQLHKAEPSCPWLALCLGQVLRQSLRVPKLVVAQTAATVPSGLSCADCGILIHSSESP